MRAEPVGGPLGYTSHPRAPGPRGGAPRCRLLAADRHEILLLAALDQQRHDDAALALDRRRELAHGFHWRARHPQDDVAGTDAGCRGRAVDIVDDQRTLRTGLLLLLRRQRPHRQTQRSGFTLGAAAAFALARLRSRG